MAASIASIAMSTGAASIDEAQIATNLGVKLKEDAVWWAVHVVMFWGAMSFYICSVFEIRRNKEEIKENNREYEARHFSRTRGEILYANYFKFPNSIKACKDNYKFVKHKLALKYNYIVKNKHFIIDIYVPFILFCIAVVLLAIY